MNMSLLHTDGGAGGHEDRYGQFRLGDDELIVYDRENSRAWVRVAPPALLEA